MRFASIVRRSTGGGMSEWRMESDMTGEESSRSADEILADLGLTSVPEGVESEPVFGAALGGGSVDEAVDLDHDTLRSAVDEMIAELGTGFGATAIWDRGTERVFVEIEAPPGAPKLFNNLTREIATSLDTAGFPDINRYFLIDLKDGIMIVIIKHREDVLQGILVSAESVNLGSLFGFVIPAQLEAVEAARR